MEDYLYVEITLGNRKHVYPLKGHVRPKGLFRFILVADIPPEARRKGRTCRINHNVEKIMKQGILLK